MLVLFESHLCSKNKQALPAGCSQPITTISSRVRNKANSLTTLKWYVFVGNLRSLSHVIMVRRALVE